MKTLVLGSGIIGTTTAYALWRAGCEVSVMDRNAQSAAETSYANGGQLSFSHVEPWASPGLLKSLPRWMLHDDAPVRFRLSRDPDFWRWGARFLASCTRTKVAYTSQQLLGLSLYSKACLAEICDETGITFDHQAKGTLHIYRTEEELVSAARHATPLARQGCEVEVLDREALLHKEPALRYTNAPLAGALYYPLDESGDAMQFTQKLGHWLAERGVDFQYNTTISHLEREGQRIRGVITDRGRFTADQYVLAAGVGSRHIARQVGIRLPLYPMRGYSVTLPCNDNDACMPVHAITDNANRMVYSRLGSRLRVAGMADIGGRPSDAGLRATDERRARQVLDKARQLFPTGGDSTAAQFWSGMRPATPHGAPIIGRNGIANVTINTGHGTLGWTLAAGSASLAADIVTGKAPAIAYDAGGL